MAESILVEIEVTEEVTYNVRVRMERAEFEKTEKQLNESRGGDWVAAHQKVFDEHINRSRDLYAREDVEVLTFRVIPEEGR